MAYILPNISIVLTLGKYIFIHSHTEDFIIVAKCIVFCEENIDNLLFIINHTTNYSFPKSLLTRKPRIHFKISQKTSL